MKLSAIAKALTAIILRTEVGQKKNTTKMREIVHLQAGQCGNQIGAKVSNQFCFVEFFEVLNPLNSLGWPFAKTGAFL